MNMESRPGTYVLVLWSRKPTTISVGKWGTLAVSRGFYLYAGSAFGPGGVLARVGRHRRSGKTLRWHIDYLREVTDVHQIWFTHSRIRQEHKWAQALAECIGTVAVSGFGCSDCQCDSHLFQVANKDALKLCEREISKLPGTLKVEPG